MYPESENNEYTGEVTAEESVIADEELNSSETEAETEVIDGTSVPDCTEENSDALSETPSESEDKETAPQDDAGQEISEPGSEETEAEGDDVQATSDDASEETETEAASEEELEEETEEKPAKKTFYLQYGEEEVPSLLDLDGTLKFISEQMRYDGGQLSQARKAKDGSAVIQSTEKASDCCSYCGLPISGVDYYRLPDGRKRCTGCSRSMVKSYDDLKKIFNDVISNMEMFFDATIDTHMTVEMTEERKLKRKVRHGLGTPPKNVLILGVAVQEDDSYTIYIENGLPHVSAISTFAHELTHIWQYTHWDQKQMRKKYKKSELLEIYEGMAKWVEIQYLYHIGEHTMAKREELITLERDDEYGRGFIRYLDRYPLTTEPKTFIDTPFNSTLS